MVQHMGRMQPVRALKALPQDPPPLPAPAPAAFYSLCCTISAFRRKALVHLPWPRTLGSVITA